MKRIHLFLIVILALIVTMALCTVISAACNAPTLEEFNQMQDERRETEDESLTAVWQDEASVTELL